MADLCAAVWKRHLNAQPAWNLPSPRLIYPVLPLPLTRFVAFISRAALPVRRAKPLRLDPALR